MKDNIICHSTERSEEWNLYRLIISVEIPVIIR